MQEKLNFGTFQHKGKDYFNQVLIKMLGVLPVFWGWKGDWLAVGKPPKLLEPLDCPNASKFAKPALAEFCAVNRKGTKHVNGYGK